MKYFLLSSCFLVMCWSSRSVLGENSACGGMLTSTSQLASLEYKVGQPYEPNERCIWLIQRQSSLVGKRILFKMVSANFADPQFDSVEIYSLEHAAGPRHEKSLKMAGDSANPMAWSAVVIFQSGRSVNGGGSGFNLTYEDSFYFPPNPVSYSGGQFLYDQPSGFFEHFPNIYPEYASYHWVIHPKAQDTELTLHYLNFSPYDSKKLQLYTVVPAGGNTTVIQEFESGLGPLKIKVVSGNQPFFLFLYTGVSSYSGSDVGIQAYWKLQSPPNFEHNPGATTTTRRTPTDGASDTKIGQLVLQITAACLLAFFQNF